MEKTKTVQPENAGREGRPSSRGKGWPKRDPATGLIQLNWEEKRTTLN